MLKFGLVAVPLLLAMTLVGCAPSVRPTASPTATSSPSPTAAAVPTHPRPVLDAGCAELLPAEQVSTMFGTPVRLRVDETASPTDSADVASRQAGGLRCVWGGDTRTDDGYDDTVVVSVIPAGAADYERYAAALTGTDDLVTDVAGDHSMASCSGSADQSSCTGQLLVGQYWLSILYSNGYGAGSTAGTPTQLLQGAMIQLAAAVRAAGPPRTAFRAPADAWTGASLCDTGARARFESAFGVTGFGPIDVTDGPPYDAAAIAMDRVGEVRCAWMLPDEPASGVTSVSATLVPGAGWALAEQLADPPSGYYFGEKEPVAIAGADSAMMACNSIDCDAYLRVDSSWLDVVVSGGGTDPATTATQIAALLAATPRD